MTAPRLRLRQINCMLGLTHAERNGHLCIDGFEGAPAAEAQAFAAAHPDLYSRADRPTLSIQNGALATGSLLSVPGFASGAEPNWRAMRALSSPHIPERITA